MAEQLSLKKSNKVHSSIQILFTGQQLEKDITDNIPNGFIIDEVPFIETELSTDTITIESLKNLANQNAVVVITSQIAVDWLAKNIITVPNWSIACMKGETQKSLCDKGWGGLVQQTANNGLKLAMEIALHIPVGTTIHFLGSRQRLATLPNYLLGQGYKVNELIAYTTLAKKQVLQKKYDAVVFLSPSAVNSFFEQNTLDANMRIFAIGQTTANAVKKLSNNELIISKDTSQLELFNTIYNYYQTICH